MKKIFTTLALAIISLTTFAQAATDKYTVKVQYVGDNNHESFVGDDITAKIGKKDPPTELADNQKPKAIDGLKYTGDKF